MQFKVNFLWTVFELIRGLVARWVEPPERKHILYYTKRLGGGWMLCFGDRQLLKRLHEGENQDAVIRTAPNHIFCGSISATDTDASKETQRYIFAAPVDSCFAKLPLTKNLCIETNQPIARGLTCAIARLRETHGEPHHNNDCGVYWGKVKPFPKSFSISECLFVPYRALFTPPAASPSPLHAVCSFAGTVLYLRTCREIARRNQAIQLPTISNQRWTRQPQNSLYPQIPNQKLINQLKHHWRKILAD